jgi:hypothetical protein
MSQLSVNATYTAISPNLTSSLLATGGTPPYSYKVLQGGIGGYINPVNAIYSAPNAYGIDTIQIVDNVGAIVQIDILVGSAIQLVCDIIQTYMGLSQGQVYLWDQKINIPTDYRLYIAVGISSCKPFGNSNRVVNGISMQGVNMLARLDINILSRTADALNLKEQILLALNSTYAEQQMEKNSFQIAAIPTGFVNLSQIDGPAIPYRFVISTNLQYFVPSTMPIQYFDVFAPVSILTND